MNRRPRPWRPKRLLGSFRFGEDHREDLGSQPERLVVYLPARLLEEAERQAVARGEKTVQRYCESILARVIEEERAREDVKRVEAVRGTLEGLRGVEDDLDYLTELTISRQPPNLRPVARPDGENYPVRAIEAERFEPEADGMAGGVHYQRVLWHAGLVEGTEPGGFLEGLRRGESPAEELAAGLLDSLHALEQDLREVAVIDRTLAYALHKLAFEGQILISETWAASVVDTATVSLLRRVQEGVDRILSGMDIRYDQV